ncbi:hypothetical protein PL8927_510014 [Planktothrix serta PCC 8927]|uniref:Uncharacterized protein n=1 Tax=Planktothrix serta PCC 8927 TaxID=671068 RepID=A0A7Z9BQ22_9CYAN|nr:hypothetical protein [Planktothrix serta]VXD15985.1 hypothetical protein PL8927_510014 [Planktothrix serta PCC 8927]
MDTFTRFLEWFPHRFHWIYKPAWGRWTTETKYPISDGVLIKKWENPLEIVGVRFGKLTRYAMLDIDKGSPYHPKNGGDIPGLLNTLEFMGFHRHILIQSSDSYGLHIYLPLPAPVPTFKLAVALKNFLTNNGFTVRSAHLEIFPNVKAYSFDKITDYNGHRLPLQPQSGSCVLDPDNLFPSSNGFNLDFFLKLMDWGAAGQDFPVIQDFINNAKLSRHQRPDSLSANAAKWRQDLESSLERGWTGDGQTNEILKNLLKIGAVFHHLVGENLVNWMVATSESLPGFKKWCDHQNDLIKRCREWVSCNDSHQYYKAYCSRPQRVVPHEEVFVLDANERLRQEARNRISLCAKAIAGQAITTVRGFITALKEKSLELFGTAPSTATLYKHRDIWEGYETADVELDTAIIEDSLETENNEELGRFTPPLNEGFVNPKILQKTGGVGGGFEDNTNVPRVANRIEKAKALVDERVRKFREKLGLCDSHTSSDSQKNSPIDQDITGTDSVLDRGYLEFLSSELSLEFVSNVPRNIAEAIASSLWADIQKFEDLCHDEIS